MNIVITGASRGIGKAIATEFAKEAHTFFLSSRNEDALNSAVAELKTSFPSITIYAAAFDLSVKENAIALAKAVQEKMTVIDILINNAGFFIPGNISDEEDGALEKMIATNLYNAYHLTRALLPAMKKQKKGHIFNICSIASLQAYPGGGAYSISKFALAGFSKNLREEMKPHGIKVTTVYPGAVMTDSWGDFDNSRHRIIEAGDIAALVAAASHLSPGACLEEIIIRPQLGDL